MKNIIFWVGVKSNDPLLIEKHGSFEYFEYSKLTWKYWCKKNNVVFYEYNNPSLKDTGTHKVTWQRWFDLEEQLKDIEWDKVAVVDASYMIKWDTPNFFESTSKDLSVFRSLENVKWINEGIKGYNKLFPRVNFDLKRYMDCGFQIFSKSHLLFLNDLKQYYFDNLDKILELQSNISRGTDQPIYNYLLQKNKINFKFELPNSFNINHMNRFSWFSHNWQLNENKTPFFIKYGYLWKFSGFDRKDRNHLMKQTWDVIKNKYNPLNEKYDKILNTTNHRHKEAKSTSRKFKYNLLEEFLNDNYKDKTVIEIGCHKGNSTKFLSQIFKKVIAVDKWHLEAAKDHCKNHNNVEFIQMDLYQDKWEDFLPKKADVVFIDAGHEYWQVKKDIENSIKLWKENNPVIVFDDYGLPPGEVKKAIDEMVSLNLIEISKFIGESPEELISAGGTKFFDMEGCICTLKNN
jgi:23S rRNA U2552 (ribose-2'-O)-methylase RlmE/FtsJ